MKKFFFTLIAIFLVVSGYSKQYDLTSPDGNIKLKINISQKSTYSLFFKEKELVKQSNLSMKFENGIVAGENMKVKKALTKSVNEVIVAPISTKFKNIEDKYNQLTLQSKDYDIIFRAYDDGIAYRFVTKFKKATKVISEVVEYNLTEDCSTFFGKEDSMFTHQERAYETKNLSEYKKGDFASPPMIATFDGDVRLLLTEADLEEYAGMYIAIDGDNKLKGVFPNYPLEVTPKGGNSDRSIPVTKYADYMAEVEGSRSFPWRVAVVTDNDAKLLETTMVYRLASPSRIEDTSWIEGGKVAWDWWTYANIYGVDFKSGINNKTYKYFIDKASKNGMKYIILDEGWYDIKKELLDVVPEINVPELVDYGTTKGVGIILWATWNALERSEDIALDTFVKWGVKGIKIDFMQRDDQKMVEFYYRIAKKAADRKLLVDYHGNYKPTGLHRTFPNVVTYEGVKGLENMKWSELPNPQHNTTIPFLRMVAGPMDYTPGGMNNVHPEEFKINYYRPFTIGTRAHQLGLYVVFESPLQMIAENPTDMDKETLSMEFISQVPTTWDETKAIDAKIGEYIVVARRNGEKWFLGAITNNTKRAFEVKLDFLGEGNYKITSWEDGINVDKQARDHAKHEETVTKDSKVDMKLYMGGGYVAIIEKVK